MRSALRKLGNSSGVIIPKSLLDEAGVGVGDVVEVTIEDGRIVLAPVTHGKRAGWAEAARRSAEAGDDAPIWPEFGNSEDDLLDW